MFNVLLLQLVLCRVMILKLAPYFVHGAVYILNFGPLNSADIRGVFQKYAESFHRMFAIADRLIIFHVKHARYMFIKYMYVPLLFAQT